MSRLLLQEKSLAENSVYVGLNREVVIVTGLGFAIHDGVNAGGILVEYKRLTSGKNFIRNANFSVQQNGTSWLGNTANKYIADGYYLQHAGGTTSNASVSVIHRQGEGDINHSLRVTTIDATPNASSMCLLSQRFVGIPLLAGRTLTLSFKAKATRNARIACEFGQTYFTATPSTTTLAGNADLSTNWKRFELTFKAPDLPDPYSLTSNSCNYIYFWIMAGDAYNGRTGGINKDPVTIDLANIQLEAAEEATLFEVRSYQEELAMVQEYYEVYAGNPKPLVSGGFSTFGKSFTEIRFQNRKRSGGAPALSNVTVENAANATTLWAQEDGFSIQADPTSTTSVARLTGYIASKEIAP